MADSLRVAVLEHPVDATVTVPGSKSIANRALACPALATGTSRLSNLPDGDDTTAMLACVGALGLGVRHRAGSVEIDAGDRHWPADAAHLHAGLAGTTSRFAMALAALGSSPITVDGDPPLRRR